MTFKTLLYKNIFWLRWEGRLVEGDIAPLQEAFNQATTSDPPPRVFVMIAPLSLTLPPIQLRGRFAQVSSTNFHKWTSAHIFVEGDGLKAGLIRMGIAGARLLSKPLGEKLVSHDTIESLLTSVEKDSGLFASDILSAAMQGGILIK